MTSPTPGSLVLERVRPLDETGRFGPATTVVVIDGIIQPEGTPVPDGVVRVDGRGRYLMPGFADCHLHLGCFTDDMFLMGAMTATRWTLEVAANARRVLDMGITLVRDVATSDAGIREGIADGLVPGPTMRVSGPPLSQTGGHSDGYLPSIGREMLGGFLVPEYAGRGDYLVDGVEEMRKAIRRQARAGVDWIKLCTTGGLLSTVRDHPDTSEFTDAEIRTAIEEATRAGIPVTAHAYGGAGLTAAVEAGVRSIEHGMFLDERQADLMAARGAWLVPTLVVVEELAELAAKGLLPASAAARVREVHSRSGRQVEVARAAGVRIAVGSDLVVQGRNLEELALLHDAGMPAPEVLLAATLGGAELMGLADTHGRIAAGYVFDAVLIDDDPLSMRPFRTTRPVSAVFQGGRIIRDEVAA
ncbi:amidohydrolase family protein [Amnibacterium flavum]|uniref:Amidohydrolase n=1 Tax=Amnibacterium flavum TaxID=2173173 RepID=A0A2V1HW52_9MICO|nr:amidohydrolase family protein [Amnibacterium flavum]PVZ95369.1 amidohydrolase [Amnibacterium flavum]